MKMPPLVLSTCLLACPLLFLHQSCAAPKSTAESAAKPETQSMQQASAAPVPVSQRRVLLLAPGREPVSVDVEVVDTPAARQRGLMFRKTMAPDHGMLFLFDRDGQQSFWMRNTDLALDMLFIRSDMTVLGIVENAQPHTDDPRSVAGLSRYVLEVNAGFSRTHGLGPGTKVRFEGIDIH